mmetsp:Transcript_21809/g.71191  ORF Transcript_21809/g.71191 Transcript_21809/m.71191 type:complete len:330 (-) Transcript_21809:12-1001(-)
MRGPRERAAGARAAGAREETRSSVSSRVWRTSSRSRSSRRGSWSWSSPRSPVAAPARALGQSRARGRPAGVHAAQRRRRRCRTPRRRSSASSARAESGSGPCASRSSGPPERRRTRLPRPAPPAASTRWARSCEVPSGTMRGCALFTTRPRSGRRGTWRRRSAARWRTRCERPRCGCSPGRLSTSARFSTCAPTARRLPPGQPHRAPRCTRGPMLPTSRLARQAPASLARPLVSAGPGGQPSSVRERCRQCRRRRIRRARRTMSCPGSRSRCCRSAAFTRRPTCTPRQSTPRPTSLARARFLRRGGGLAVLEVCHVQRVRCAARVYFLL